MNSPKSRLSRNLEKQTKRQIITSAVSIVVIILLFLKFGPSLIGAVGDVIFNLKGNQNDVKKYSNIDYIEPPTLNPISKVSEDGKVTVSGTTTSDKGTVEILINNTSYTHIEIASGKFSKENLKLNPGNNVIKARINKDNKSSDFSDELQVSFYKDAPKLDIDFPSDGTNFTKADQNIEVKGKTDPEGIITVNGSRAIINSDGSFSYYLKLNDGDNTIEIEASNTSDKKTKKEIKVKYQP